MNNYLLYVDRLGKVLKLPALALTLIIVIQIISIIILSILIASNTKMGRIKKEEKPKVKEQSPKETKTEESKVVPDKPSDVKVYNSTSKMTANIDARQAMPATESQMSNESYNYKEFNTNDLSVTDFNDEKEEVISVKVDERKKLISRQIVYHVKSFTAKMCLSSDTIKDYYQELTNYILSNKNVINNVKWLYDSYKSNGFTIARISINRKTLCLYLPFIEGEIPYDYDDVSHIKRFQKTPILLKITNEERVKQGEELIQLVLNKFEIKEKVDVQIDVKSKFPSVDEYILKNMGLIDDIYYEEICDLEGHRISLNKVKNK